MYIRSRGPITRVDNTLQNQDEIKYKKSDMWFLFTIILLYMLTCVPLAGSIPLYARYIILPVMILFSFKNNEEPVQMDWVTVLLFFTAVFPSIVFSPYMSNAVVKAATVLLMFVGCSMYFNSRCYTGLQSLYRALVVFGYVCVAANFFRFLIGQGYSGDNFRGYFGNRNACGAALVTVAIIMFSEIWKSTGKKKLLPILFLALDIFMIIITYSRGAFLGLIIGLVVFLFFVYEDKVKLLGICILIFIVAFLFRNQIYQMPIYERFTSEGLSRNELWDYAFQVIRENFLTGVGFSSSQFTNQLEGNEGYNFHNSYIGLMADVGIFGIILLVIMFLIIGVRIYFRYKNISHENRIQYVALIAICIAFFGLSFGEAYLIVAGSPFSFVFWCCMFCLSQYQENVDIKV